MWRAGEIIEARKADTNKAVPLVGLDIVAHIETAMNKSFALEICRSTCVAKLVEEGVTETSGRATESGRQNQDIVSELFTYSHRMTLGPKNIVVRPMTNASRR